MKPLTFDQRLRNMILRKRRASGYALAGSPSGGAGTQDVTDRAARKLGVVSTSRANAALQLKALFSDQRAAGAVGVGITTVTLRTVAANVVDQVNYIFGDGTGDTGTHFYRDDAGVQLTPSQASNAVETRIGTQFVFTTSDVLVVSAANGNPGAVNVFGYEWE